MYVSSSLEEQFKPRHICPLYSEIETIITCSLPIKIETIAKSQGWLIPWLPRWGN